MKHLVFLTFLVYAVAGVPNLVVHTVDSISHQTGLRRTAISSLNSLFNSLLIGLESTIISNCKKNGHQQIADNLQNTYDDLKVCLNKKTIFVATKSEFLDNIDECSREAVKQTKSCMDNQKYFPELLLDLVKSLAGLMYDDKDILTNDLPHCVRLFANYNVQRSYIQCMADVAVQTGDSSQIPTSKATFCKSFVPTSYCFTNMIKDNCARTKNLDKLREDYVNATKSPCDKKDSEYILSYFS